MSSGDEQGAGVQLVVPVKTSVDQLSSSDVQLVSTDSDDLALVPVQTVHNQRPPDSSSETLRTLPDVRNSGSTYVILKLSGNDDVGAAGKAQRGRSSGEIVAERSVELGDKVKYIDLSALLSNSHLSVTSPKPHRSPTSRRRPPKSRRRSARPPAATKPAQRRPRRPLPPAKAPPSPPSRSRHRPPPPPPLPRPLPAPVPRHQPRNDQSSNNNQRQLELSEYNHEQRQYPPPVSRYEPQHQQHYQQQPEYSSPNEHHHHSHQSPRYETHSGAILPRFRPTAV